MDVKTTSGSQFLGKQKIKIQRFETGQEVLGNEMELVKLLMYRFEIEIK